MTDRTWRVPRSRGALAGLLLVLLGAWGALIAVIGPIFDYAYTPDAAWTMTTGRWILQVAPGVAVVIGGLLLMTARDRATGTLGGWLAAVGGAWFVVGPILSQLWDPTGDFLGRPLGFEMGSATQAVLEQIGIFYGLGVVIVFLAATAAGRFSLQGVGDIAAAEAARERRLARQRRETGTDRRGPEPVGPDPGTRGEPGRPDRERRIEETPDRGQR